MCKVFLLDGSSVSLEIFNQLLAEGYTIVDRFTVPQGEVLMYKKP